MSNPAPPESPHPHARWKFARDVIVFQLKLVLGNLHNFLFVPVSLGAAAIDLVFRHEKEGARFYRVIGWAKHADEMIDLYSALDEDGEGLKKEYSVDAVVARLEGVIVREYEKGGTAASVKAAVDKAIDQLQREAGKGKAKADDAVKLVTDKLRGKTDGTPGA
jgi:ribosome-associated translation inhibitor RaiA